MEMYFPAEVNPLMALRAVQFWKQNYHVDGFHLYNAGRLLRGEDGIPDVDVSITTRELDIMLRANHISPVHLPEEEFDSPLGSGTGAAA